jgi:GNAT superfamily N-acetyltransferase
MPTIHILKKSAVRSSFRVEQVRGMFDFSLDHVTHEHTADLPLDEKTWQIGLICGPSGAGKSTLAAEAFPVFHQHHGSVWHDDRALIDDFPEQLNTKSIVQALSAVGFSTPPMWLKPFATLSNGQQFRVELARALLSADKGLVFDEFTSVVDRDVARIGSAAVSKMLRNRGTPPFVAVSCHYDIIDWLDPDWVYDVGNSSFEWRQRRRFPEIRLEVHRTNADAWRLFRQHHYLDSHLHRSAQCYLATWEGQPVAFGAVLHFPHANEDRFKREHRIVVLPDYQGIGIGNRLSEHLGRLYTAQGYRYISTTSNPAMIWHRHRSLLWRTNRFGNASKYRQESAKLGFEKTGSSTRITGGFEYVGTV